MILRGLLLRVCQADPLGDPLRSAGPPRQSRTSETTLEKLRAQCDSASGLPFRISRVLSRSFTSATTFHHLSSRVARANARLNGHSRGGEALVDNPPKGGHRLLFGIKEILEESTAVERRWELNALQLAQVELPGDVGHEAAGFDDLPHERGEGRSRIGFPLTQVRNLP